MVVFMLGLLIGFIAGAVAVAFFVMVADMSSVRPSGEVLDFTGRTVDKIGTTRRPAR